MSHTPSKDAKIKSFTVPDILAPRRYCVPSRGPREAFQQVEVTDELHS